MVSTFFHYFTLLIVPPILVIIYKFFPRGEFQRIPTLNTFQLVLASIHGEPYDVKFHRILSPLFAHSPIIKFLLGGKWELMISDFELIDQILKDKHSLKHEPGVVLDKLLMYHFLGKDNIVHCDGKEWLKHRKVMNPAFKKLLSTELVAKRTFQLLNILEEWNFNCGGEEVEIQPLIQKLTLDVMGLALLNYDFQALSSVIGEPKSNLTNYNLIMEAMFEPIYYLIPKLEDLVPSRRKFHELASEHRQFMFAILNQRRNQLDSEGGEATQDDMLTLLIQAGKEVDGLTDEQMVNDLATLFAAGHDTTANTLSIIIYYLATNPVLQEKVYLELQSVLNIDTTRGDEELKVASLEQLSQLTYLEAVMLESMRMKSSVTEVRRFISKDLPLHTDQLGDFVVPRGTDVTLCLYAVHHDPQLYPKPHTFNPERFLNEGGGLKSVKGDSSWLAFGNGNRNCVGQKFSMTQQKTILSLMLQRFSIVATKNTRCHLTSDGLVKPKNLVVRFCKR